MIAAVPRRFRDVLCSVYLYNEYQAAVSLARLRNAVRDRLPAEAELLAAVDKHQRDERKHYLMFKRYFRSEGRMPFVVDAGHGYIDRFVELTYGCALEDLDPDRMVEGEKPFTRLCRLIMMTEFRGLAQVRSLVRSPLVSRHPRLRRIFAVIERDEPSHCLPYRDWLRARGLHQPGPRERRTDRRVHYSLMLVRMPRLLLDPRAPRRTVFPDEVAPRAA